MTVCSFLGEKNLLIDDLQKSLEKAFHKIISENDELEFWFYQKGDFYTYCLTEALRARQRYPQKSISIVFVYHTGVDADAEPPGIIVAAGEVEPKCIVDKRIASPVPIGTDDRSRSRSYDKAERWLIERSDYVICYVYRELYWPVNRLYKYAKKIKDNRLFDITNRQTTAFIKEQYRLLTNEEQFIFQELKKGTKQTRIAEMTGLISESVRYRMWRAGEKLQNIAKTRYKKMNQSNREKICGIFNLKPIEDEELLSMLEMTIRYLNRKHQICKFYVEEHSDFVKYVDRFRYRFDNLRNRVQFIAWISHPDDPDTDWSKIKQRYCPPFDEIKNFDAQAKPQKQRMLRSVKGMLDAMDFCVCTMDSNAEEILRHMSKKGKAVVINLEVNDGITEQKKVDKISERAPIYS